MRRDLGRSCRKSLCLQHRERQYGDRDRLSEGNSRSQSSGEGRAIAGTCPQQRKRAQAGSRAPAQFLPILHLREVIAVVLLLLGAVVALRAVDHWARTERAMRLNEELPGSKFPAILAILVALGAILLIVLVLVRALE